MTTTGVREALAVLPTWRRAAAYVGAYLVVLLLNNTARVSGPLLGAAAGYVLAGPVGAVVGLLVGGANQDGPLFALVSALLLDGAARLGRSANRSAVAAADFAAAAAAGTTETTPAAVFVRPLIVVGV